MIDREIFSNRFKCLRIAHCLSSSQLATLLNFKSKGSIGNLESGKAVPLSGSLADIADLFAVSLDWLVGRSNIPYTEELMMKMEDHFWDRIAFYMNQVGDRITGFPAIPEKYKNSQSRSQVYPLKIRANILFLFSVMLLTAKSLHGEDESVYHSPFFRISKPDRVLQEDTPARNLNLEEHSVYLKELSKKYSRPVVQILEGLFTQEITEPLFDISKQPIKK